MLFPAGNSLAWECLATSHLVLQDLQGKSPQDKSGALGNPGVGIQLRQSQRPSQGSSSAWEGARNGAGNGLGSSSLMPGNGHKFPPGTGVGGTKQHRPLGGPSDGILGISPSSPRQTLGFTSSSALRAHREAEPGKGPHMPGFGRRLRLAGPGGRAQLTGRTGLEPFPTQLLPAPFCLLAAALPGSFPARGWRSHSILCFPLFPLYFSSQNNPSITGLFSARCGPDPAAEPRAGGFQRRG